MKREYRLEVNKGVFANIYSGNKYRLFKYEDDGKRSYEIFKEKSKIKLYMQLDLLGIRNKMKFNRFYRIGASEKGPIMFAEFIFV